MKSPHALAAVLLAASALFSLAQNPAERGPLSAEEELKTIQVADGLRVELVAADPMVESPCAMAFDDAGRLFVAENRGYPHTVEPPVGRIVMLESTKQDGHYDKRTVFAEGLTFPNGVMPWDGGLIVTCAPDIYFLRDTDGDGKADEKRVLLTGFDATKSTQLRVNCPTVGPDGWIYFAAGLSAGTITSPDHPEKPAVKMTGDLRWNPKTGDFETVDGRSQYGMAFDDFGRRFICMNRLPVQHVVIESHWLRRNPHLAFGETVQDCNERTVKTGLKGGGDGVRLFPISHNITTADSHAGSFTAACSVRIWRGGALPEMFNGCALSCEPTGNLVHADKLIPRGATFAAMPLFEKRELFASSDDWCRPVFLTSGPDGALYVCDMYRKIIEHPDYLPEEIRKHSDFESGKKNGRIWRITGAGKKWEPEKWPRLHMDSDEWARDAVAIIGNENGWWRETAYRVLIEKRQTNEALKIESALKSAFWVVTIPAGLAAILSAHDGFVITAEMISTALQSPNPGLREFALLHYRHLLSPKNDAGEFSLNKDVLACAQSDDARVRFACALALGDRNQNMPPSELDDRIIPGLASIAARGADDRWTRAAVLSGIAGRERDFTETVFARLNDRQVGAADLLGELGVVFGRALTAAKRDPFSTDALPNVENTPAGLRVAFLAGVADGASLRFGKAAPAWVHVTVATAAELVTAKNTPLESQLRAVSLLKHAEWDASSKPLLALATATDASTPADLRAAAVRSLATFDNADASTALLAPKRLAALTPLDRDVTVSALIARPTHAPRVLDAVEAGALPRTAVSAAERTALSKSKDAAVRDRAAKLFGAPADGDRMKAYEASKAVLALAPKAAHGKEVFKVLCSSCHRLDQEGFNVGPDLLGMRSQPKESILLHIVVPDYEIIAAFAASNVELKDGRILAGIIISDTPESITLRQPLGVEENVPRANIKSLTASEHSLMPPGLESVMKPQDLADLLSFLKGEAQ